MKSKEYANDMEIERLEALEKDRDFKILEQKHFEQKLGGSPIMDLEPREARLQDIEIYKQGNLEY